MDQGIVDEGVVLRIGFLDDGENEHKLDQYSDTFDIVILKDQSMDVPIALLDVLFGVKA